MQSRSDAEVPAPLPIAGGEAGEPLRGKGWRGLIELFSERIGKYRPAPRERVQLLMQAAEAMVSETSDAQAVGFAIALASELRGLADPELLQFFVALADRFGPDETLLKPAAVAYVADPTPQTVAALTLAAEPRRLEVLRRLNMAPEGTALIVRLRQKVLEAARTQPNLAPLAADMQQLLSSWFNRGFLKVEQLNWNSPAAVLENVIRYEAVHEIHDWDSLRSRLQGNRRCFGFFHPAMPGVPLIFVEVALAHEMSDAIGPLLAGAEQEQPRKAPTHAIFYSINNCHPGLKGINLGDLLIKQVVLDLRNEFPSLNCFATLSPIPRFRKWLAKAELTPGLTPTFLSDLLAKDGWWLDPALCERARQPLLGLCADYLSGRAPDGSQGQVTDPVARFHLSNGARIERIDWLGDTSEKGLAESWGMMVNYHYRLNAIEAQHRAFVDENHVSVSTAVKQLRDSTSADRPRFSLSSGVVMPKWPVRRAASAD